MKRNRAVRIGRAEDAYVSRLVATRNYSRLISLKLEKLFPDKATRMQALRLLERYGADSGEFKVERVRLAILRSSGTDLHQIESGVRGAKEDYQDIIAWAETPARMRCGMANRKLSPVELSNVEEQDKRQYEDWLNEA